MPRYIDADALLEKIDEYEPMNWTDSDRERQEVKDFELFRSMVESAPTADEVVLKQENFAELPVDKFTPELTPEEKALIKLWKGQGGRDELESVLRMFGAKMDGNGDKE